MDCISGLRGDVTISGFKRSCLFSLSGLSAPSGPDLAKNGLVFFSLLFWLILQIQFMNESWALFLVFFLSLIYNTFLYWVSCIQCSNLTPTTSVYFPAARSFPLSLLFTSSHFIAFTSVSGIVVHSELGSTCVIRCKGPDLLFIAWILASFLSLLVCRADFNGLNIIYILAQTVQSQEDNCQHFVSVSVSDPGISNLTWPLNCSPSLLLYTCPYPALSSLSVTAFYF